MKQIIDFIPLIVFFILYKMYDIYVATGALIVASALQIVVLYLLYKKVEKMQLITFVMVAVFGSMTLILHDADFIKWKVTIVYAVLAAALAISHLIGKSAIKSMLGKEIELPDAVWARITWAWVGFFSICAALNIYVAFHLSQDVWVNFKVFGLLAATFLFTLLTGVYIYRYLPKDKKSLPKDNKVD